MANSRNDTVSIDGAEPIDDLIPLVYAELRSLAHRHLVKESRKDVLQTTALVHEAYLRLAHGNRRWQSRRHFMATASNVMRRLLVDMARKRSRQKRGNNALHVPIEESLTSAPQRETDILVLNDLMDRLASHDDRKARVVELRIFGGLTIAEVADVLAVSHATVERDLKFARTWLARELSVHQEA